MSDVVGTGGRSVPGMALPQLEDLPPCSGRRVLVRSDLNVPLRPDATGRVEVADDRRIRASLPTIEWLLGAGADVTVCSHLGRPSGRVDPRLSIGPVRDRLLALLARTPGDGARRVRLLENLRFDPGEEANDPSFVRRLVEGVDCYVDDAFGAAHRAHASIVGPPSLLPSAAGRLVVREVDVLLGVRNAPVRPFVAVVGGLKVAGKLELLAALAERADRLLIGGAMAFTFLAALGHDVGDSPVEADLVGAARELCASGSSVELAHDVLALSPGEPGLGEPGRGEVRRFEGDLPAGWRGLDVGPGTVARFTHAIAAAGTVLWNGPMGMVEDPRFAAGTAGIAGAVAACPGLSVAGGGDTAAALDRLGLAERVGHVSSGGGAMLELVARGDLPGLAALRVAPGRAGGAVRP